METLVSVISVDNSGAICLILFSLKTSQLAVAILKLLRPNNLQNSFKVVHFCSTAFLTNMSLEIIQK